MRLLPLFLKPSNDGILSGILNGIASVALLPRNDEFCGILEFSAMRFSDQAGNDIVEAGNSI